MVELDFLALGGRDDLTADGSFSRSFYISTVERNTPTHRPAPDDPA
jgi:hypothetical protein